MTNNEAIKEYINNKLANLDLLAKLMAISPDDDEITTARKEAYFKCINGIVRDFKNDLKELENG